MTFHRFILLLAAIALGGCAHFPTDPQASEASKYLRRAREKNNPTETRVALYLQAAATAANTAPASSRKNGKTASNNTYSTACSELAILLRTAEGGQLWNRPLTFTGDGVPYRLRYQTAKQKGIWDPNYFTSFVPAEKVAPGSIKNPNRVEGIGGKLVGIHKQDPLETFSPKVGTTAPVTATLDFNGQEATLALHDPTVQQQTRVAEIQKPLAADFSAPLAYYPQVNETLAGLMGAIKVSNYMDSTGLYVLQPYDPNRIPVIFVHGLISTPRMWRNVINELQKDPELRSRYQFWVFGYPTGNPAAYSALRLRQELAKAKEKYGLPKGVVLVGHSMGGIVSRMQGVTTTREDFDRIINTPSERALMAAIGNSGLVHDALLFKANPDIRRYVFICTPHRGSEMALSSIGDLGIRLISLPGTLVDSVNQSAMEAMRLMTRKGGKFPTSVTSLSPKNPMMTVVDSLPLNAPSHTILGDRGKPGPLESSSDGIVPYWSSHLAKSVSEKVVPGPHGACEMPQTIDELKRVLHLHLKSTRN